MKVLISVVRRTTYTSIVEMSKEEYNRLNKSLDSDDFKKRNEAEETANSLIDVKDWQDDDLSDLLTFEPFVEREQKGKLRKN